MKFQDEVTIVTDTRSFEDANALRVVLESFGLRTHFIRLFQRRQALDLFGAERLPSQWTILMAHGFSNEDGCAIRFDLTDNPSEDPSAVEGWHRVDFDLTPESIPDIIKNGSGTLVTNACGAGDPRLVQAIFGAGFDSYIANPESHIDFASGLLFLFGLFYYLTVGDHEYADTFELREAVDRAQAIHGDWRHGTSKFGLFRSTEGSQDAVTA